jgi:hypothetical protein
VRQFTDLRADAIFTRNMCKLVRGALVLAKGIKVDTLYRLDVTTHVKVNSDVATIGMSQATKETFK